MNRMESQVGMGREGRTSSGHKDATENGSDSLHPLKVAECESDLSAKFSERQALEKQAEAWKSFAFREEEVKLRIGDWLSDCVGYTEVLGARVVEGLETECRV